MSEEALDRDDLLVGGNPVDASRDGRSEHRLVLVSTVLFSLVTALGLLAWAGLPWR